MCLHYDLIGWYVLYLKINYLYLKLITFIKVLLEISSWQFLMTFLVLLQLLLSGSWRSASLENIALAQVCMSWTWWMSAVVIVVVVVVVVVLDCWGWGVGRSGGSLPVFMEQNFVEFSCFLLFYWYFNRLICYYYFCEISLWVCECVRSCTLVTFSYTYA